MSFEKAVDKGFIKHRTETVDGVEKYTRFMGEHFFKKTLHSLLAQGPDSFKRMAETNIYAFRPKPFWKEILAIEANPATFEITLFIQRGHLAISDFVKEHLGHGILSESSGPYIIVECLDCEMSIRLRTDSIASRLEPECFL